jgi:hypothetical protein
LAQCLAAIGISLEAAADQDNKCRNNCEQYRQ